MPSAYGYVSVPHTLHPDDGEAALHASTRDLAELAAGAGFVLAGVFADIRGRTETGLYRLLESLRSGDAVAVIVPDLDHLRHTGCLSGADPRTAARYLRARLLVASNPDAGERVAPAHPAPDRHRAEVTGVRTTSVGLLAVLETAAQR